MENSNTQSPVEWFFRWVNDNPEATHKEFNEAFKQAKQMEEQRIQQELEKLRDFDNWKEWKTNNRF